MRKKGTLKDPECITMVMSEVGHWGNGVYEVPLFPLKRYGNGLCF